MVSRSTIRGQSVPCKGRKFALLSSDKFWMLQESETGSPRVSPFVDHPLDAVESHGSVSTAAWHSMLFRTWYPASNGRKPVVQVSATMTLQ